MLFGTKSLRFLIADALFTNPAKRSTPLALRANGHSESSPAIKVDPASAGADSNESMQALQAGPSAAKAKPVKYPIEDLELDPTTIFDGRVRRSKNELPPLPELKMPKSDLPIPQEHFGEFLACWNFLNIFGSVRFPLRIPIHASHSGFRRLNLLSSLVSH